MSVRTRTLRTTSSCTSSASRNKKEEESAREAKNQESRPTDRSTARSRLADSASKPTTKRSGKGGKGLGLSKSRSRPSLLQTCCPSLTRSNTTWTCWAQLPERLPACPNYILLTQLEHCIVGLRLGCFCSRNPAGLKDCFFFGFLLFSYST